ncbi:HNH endonuclease [Demequina oxidasica]|uniref:HNH endonuclease n=1 Tax=Demequina oxidasica TaxID=676199 RepID=UPI000780D8F0|nr:HNH endonuclease signature motif containing protein [Demequina oxidasica]
MTTTVADAPAALGIKAAADAAVGSVLGAGSSSGSRVLERVRARVGEARGWEGVDLSSLPESVLLESSSALAQIEREVNAMHAAIAHQIARRSDAGPGGLARRQGFQSPAKLIASQTGESTAEAQRLINVGDALAAKIPEVDGASGSEVGLGSTETEAKCSADAQRLSRPKYVHVSLATGAGKLSISSGNLITNMLDQVEAATTPEVRLEAERDLVERAMRLSYDQLARAVRQAEAWLDRERIEQRHQMLRDERYLTIREDQAGMTLISGKLDPETAAPVRAMLDAMVAHGLRERREQDRLAADVRSVGQMRVDALGIAARHVLGCKSEKLPMSPTALVVRMNIEDLRAEVGVGEVDGSGQPIPASVVRRMAADANVIPAVLGGESEVLELGREQRSFSVGQRRALFERDGGCAFCGAPPSFTEAHHIRWWERDDGPTDLENGVLLCVRCHHLIHRDGWRIEATASTVEFVPPATVDKSRAPRPGGRAMFDGPSDWRVTSSAPSVGPARGLGGDVGGADPDGAEADSVHAAGAEDVRAAGLILERP